ncbi:planctomycete cytochrome C domain protein [Rhodopirellula sp. SWK7]|nr:planctomycete cytochrome C domain protein [Rhodopirellula sp. SWK7]
MTSFPKTSLKPSERRPLSNPAATAFIPEPSMHRISLIALAISLAFGVVSINAEESNSEQLVATSVPERLPERVMFNAHIRPIMSNTCFTCHGPDEDENESAFRLDSFESATGPLDSDDEARGIVPGDLESSEVYKRIMGIGDGEQMPPEEFRHHLTSYEKALFAKWIEQGAEYEQHWAYAPLTHPALPEVQAHTDAIENDIDVFILSRLEKDSITPSPLADKATLLRRLSLDLIGIPPTPEELAAFLADSSADAYERQVDRLLASPHFGERMASSWLDIVRFADTVGFHGDQNMRIFPYRDYVINAFNENKPFDEFTMQQLAGDLKPNPTTEDLVATGLLRLNMITREGGAQPGEYLAKYKADRVRMIGTAWLGSTLACCECHNHKYDPFSAKDFYSLGAFFDDIQQWGVYSDYGYSPNKDLRGFNNDYPFPPEMRVASPSLKREIESLIRQRDDILMAGLGQKTLRSETYQDWEHSLNNTLAMHPDGWIPTTIIASDTSAGTAHEVLDDGSLLLTSKPAKAETISITTRPATPTKINSVRVEVLPDERNNHYVGRGEDGRFSLSFSAHVISSDDGPTMRPNRPRYVRIELSGKKILSLAEVQIFSSEKNEEGQPINVALQGTASQSSNYTSGAASLAIDGNTEGDYRKANSVTHTSLNGQNPWWEVDLGSEHSVESIVVWNRTDNGLQNRLDGFRLTLLDKDRNTLQQETPTTPKPSTRIEIPAEVMVHPESNLKVAWGEADREDPLRFRNGHPPRMLGEVWRSGPSRWQLPTTENQQPHTAVYHFDQPLELSADQQLVIRLQSTDVGRVRLSVTPIGDAIAGWNAASADLIESLAKSPEHRNERDRATLASTFHRSTEPLKRQRSEVQRFRNEILDRHSAMAMTLVTQTIPDDKIPVSRVLPRGNWQDETGELAPPAFPHFLPAGEVSSGRRLNRTDLAKWLTSPTNPLVPRHFVNRTWKQFFGTGLSSKLDDLGSQGEWPSHPLLLDRLASEFVISGWDVKHMVRMMVTSRTYRQAVTRRTELVELDPYNRLLAQASPRRLEAEAIRDNALAIAGILNQNYIGGPSVYPYQPGGHYSNLQFPNRGYTASNDARQYRRGVYMHWQRTFLHPMLVNFDAPSRDECTADRSPSNSPQQALTLLNDPTFVEASHAMAEKLLDENPDASFEDLLDAAFVRAIARNATPEEADSLRDLLDRQLIYFNEHPGDAAKFLRIGNTTSNSSDLPRIAAWSQVCRVILNLHETITRY